MRENPQAIKAFLTAFTKGVKDVMANPAAAIADVKARDGIINTEARDAPPEAGMDT
jgi:NitT/TauT family transport system substrate-binding protein